MRWLLFGRNNTATILSKYKSNDSFIGGKFGLFYQWLLNKTNNLLG